MKKLAIEFSKILTEWLGEDLAEVNELNKQEDYQNYCATHEFCDPNQAMLNAFQNTFNTEFDFNNEKHVKLFNEAWTFAKNNDFKIVE